MRIATESFLTSALMLQNPGQAEAQAAAREALREQQQAVREQQQAVREQQQAAREQVQEFKQNLKEQIQAEIDAARAAQEHGIPMPPTPPSPPGFAYTIADGAGGVPVIPQQAVEIVSIVGMTLVLCVVGFPIARAVARWMDRRGTPQAASPEMDSRLQAIEQAVESIAVEVERISEGQRFTTRVLSERTHEPVNDFVAREREAMHVGLPPDSGPGAPVNARRT